MNTIQKAKPERELARRNGLSTYFTGRPCKAGHVSNRNTVDASCVACRGSFRESYREQARTYAFERRSRMLENNPVETRRKWREEQKRERLMHPERVAQREREYGRLRRQKWPKRKLADVRKRQASKIQRTPVWAELDKIKRFYENCPEGYEVDHVAPLRGETVSGLHVISNLQYLTAPENRKKHRNFDADSYAAKWLQELKAVGL